MYDIGDVVRCSCNITTIDGIYVNPTTLTFYVRDPDGDETAYVYGTDPEVVRTNTGQYYMDVTLDEAGQWYYRYLSENPGAMGEQSFHVGVTYSTGVEMPETSDLDYLFPYLRMHLWDVSSPPAYSDSTLRRAFVTGIKMLMPRWNSRYIPAYNAVTTNWDIARNVGDVFIHAVPPLIMYGDERPIVLAASVALKSGLIYLVGQGAASWKDEEVEFSNITGSKMQEAGLIRDWDELNKLVPERRGRLARTTRQELPGYKNPPNVYEGE